MSLRRSPDPSRRSRRLVVCGVTAALLVVPGVALADETPSLGSVVPQLEGGGQDAEDAVTDLLPTLPGVTPPAGTPAAGATPTLTPPDLSQLQTLLALLQVSPECSSAVIGDLAAVVASIPATVEAVTSQLRQGLQAVLDGDSDLPTEVQGQLMDLLGTLGGAPDDDADSDGVPLADAVAQLVTDFLATCLPQPAAPATTAPASAAPVAQTSAPVAAPATTTPPAAPVAYLGYAPTGAPEESGSGTPLLALGGALLLGGGAAGTWIRLRRGVSSRG